MLSFFGDQKGKPPPKTTIVSKVAVRKPLPKTGPSPVSTLNRSSNGLLAVPSSSNGVKKNGTSPSSKTPLSSTSKPGSSSSSTFTPKRPFPERSSPTRISSPSKPIKRKASSNKIERIQSESESSSSSDSGGSSEEDALDPKPKRRRFRTGTSSTTPFPGEEEVGRNIFCLDKVDMRGEWGRGWVGFVGCEEVVRGSMRGWAGGNAGDGLKNLDKYQAYFPQPGFEKGDELPSVELLYPAVGCREKFILLTPISHREYNPISELRSALRLILEHYVPPSHQHIFGTLSDTFTEPTETASAIPSRLASPHPGSLATPPPDAGSSPTPFVPSETIGDALRKALAPNRRDGPGFVRAMERFNTAMEELQTDGSLKEWLRTKGRGMKSRDWSILVDAVHDQAYSRVVGPYSNELEHHPKHPDEVAKAIMGKEDAYGELRHNFMSQVIQQTNLTPDSVFVDLGSGVGNCVLQAALQAGSRSYGFELLPVPARCARLQVREVQRRWAMWALKGNVEVEVHEGDFRIHPVVAKRLCEADVVLVNNEVFPSSLNIDLTNMFLDLKEGATIVSLKPFVPEGFRMNESNCDSFAAIVRSSQHIYYKDWVSWKGDSGRYYVQKIDRSMRAKFEEEMSGRRRR
ncbi:hypothetical protein IAR55_006174 [Kwoniella newhampshirensis]|uniref:Histone-lysine N-methyltransferase, H3 lysine-79 specific n=1 Tax=Kwoniella newhampshirensis TaxID=1651941 RepID=A0AAW0YUJ9_9TREE